MNVYTGAPEEWRMGNNKENTPAEVAECNNALGSGRQRSPFKCRNHIHP